MDTGLLVFSSSTAANRLKKLAQKNLSVTVTLTQTPRSLSENGCTYAIRFPFGYRSALLDLCTEYEIHHGLVYKELTDAGGRRLYQQM